MDLGSSRLQCLKVTFSREVCDFVITETGWSKEKICHQLSRLQPLQPYVVQQSSFPPTDPFFILLHGQADGLIAVPCKSGCAFRPGSLQEMYSWLQPKVNSPPGREFHSPIAEMVQAPDDAVAHEELALKLINAFAEGEASLEFVSVATSNESRLKIDLASRAKEIFCRWRMKEYPIDVVSSQGTTGMINSFPEALHFDDFLNNATNRNDMTFHDQKGRRLSVIRSAQGAEMTFAFQPHGHVWHLTESGKTSISPALTREATIEWLINGEFTKLEIS